MTSRTFGIEIEITNLTPQRAAHILNLVGVNAVAEGYNHTTRAHWKVVTDASVYNGCEVVSPPLSGDEGLEQVRTAITALDDAGAKVNMTCGLHVHFDASGLTADEVRNTVRRYARFENEIDAFMPRSRRSDNNRYCRTLRGLVQSAAFRNARNLDTLIDAQDSRYFKLNLKSFHLHGTIEFRQHSGTVNAAKALNWIQFLDAFIEASRTEVAAPADQPRVSGKQATLVELMQQADGASIEQLTEATSWQRHTVRAAITRLRQRGFTVTSERRGGTTTYRTEAAAPRATADHLWRGQASDRTFLPQPRRHSGGIGGTMQYRTMDGKVFQAQSPEDLAEQLRQSQFVPAPDIAVWMEGSANRAQLYNGSTIRTDTVENHIADLIEAGFLEVME